MINERKFTSQYVNKLNNKNDDKKFRNKLGFYLENFKYNRRDPNRISPISKKLLLKEEIKEISIEQDIGFSFSKLKEDDSKYYINRGMFLSTFFNEADLEDLLDSITSIYDVLNKTNPIYGKDWLRHVEKSFREGSLKYTVASDGKVSYYIDEEYNKNKVSTISLLNEKGLDNIKNSYEKAHECLNSKNIDTKTAVKSMFEALEILTKMLVDTQLLNRAVAKNELKNLAIEKLRSDSTSEEHISEIFDSFSIWVHSMHKYRHGQKDEKIVEPSFEIAVHTISVGTSYLRLLLGLR